MQLYTDIILYVIKGETTACDVCDVCVCVCVCVRVLLLFGGGGGGEEG